MIMVKKGMNVNSILENMVMLSKYGLPSLYFAILKMRKNDARLCGMAFKIYISQYKVCISDIFSLE